MPRKKQPIKQKKIIRSTYTKFITRWLDSLESPRTRETYHRHALALVPDMERAGGDNIAAIAQQITPMIISEWCRAAHTPALIKTRTAVARGIFGVWCANGLLPINPALPVKIKKRGDVIHTPPAEPLRVRECLEKLTGSKSDIRDRAIILLGVVMGLRVSEIVGLQVDQLEFTGHIPCLRVLGKGKKVARMPCPENVRDSIEQWRRAGNIKKGNIFINLTSQSKCDRKSITRQAVYGIIKKRLGCSPHGLRSLCLTEMCSSSGDIEQAYIWARHTLRETTDVYIRGDRFEQAKGHIPQY